MSLFLFSFLIEWRIKILPASSPFKWRSKMNDLILTALRKKAESFSRDSDNVRWGMVYLDNARPNDMSRHKFAGHLSALTDRDLYAPTSDRCFGEVKMEG
jgi:hypothetical protein